MKSKKSCPFCGGRMKINQTECYRCRNTKRAIKNELAAPEYSRDIAIDHVIKKPGILKQIFGFNN